MMSEKILSINNLSIKYGMQEPVVKNISMSIASREIVGIVGESGSGKSTLARMITRLVRPDQGIILLNGRDITQLKGRRLKPVYRTVQMIFQNPRDSFDPRRTLGDGIMEILKNNGAAKDEAEKQIRDLLSTVNLPFDLALRYPHQVSGGQCQRAAIARAIAIHPQLVVCDEATSALDVTVQMQIITLLKKLQKERGVSYLFISHDLALVQAMCARAAVMRQGKIVEQGSISEVIKHPGSEYTRTLINSAV